MRLAVLLLAATGCLPLAEDPPQDPRCPKNWVRDEKMDGGCRPPDGYTALLYAEFGGSGIYGFGRLVTPCFDTSDPDEDCGPSMIPNLPVALYHPDDVTSTQIREGAVPLAQAETSKTGVYKTRLTPGEYVMTCIDPWDGRLVVGGAEVKADAVALYAIDLDHSGGTAR